MSCISKFSKFFLVFFNALFCLLGLACIVVGVLVITDRIVSTSLLANIPHFGESLDAALSSASQLREAAYIMLGLGAIVFLLAFTGCVGAIQESKCLLAAYVSFILLILGIQVSAGVGGYLYKDQVVRYMRSYLQDTLSQKYQGLSIVNGSLAESPEPYSAAWDAVMISMECCGNYNYSDFTQYADQWSRNYSYGGYELTDAVVPISCCKVTSKSALLTDLTNFNNYFINSTQCLTTADPLYTNTANCYDRMVSLVNTYSLIFFGVVIGIAALELFLIIFACCSIHTSNKRSVEPEIIQAWKV